MDTVEFPLEAGGQVLVRVAETSPSAGDVVTRGGPVAGRLEKAEQTFEAALGTIGVVAQGVLGQLRAMMVSPDEVHVEFGLELSAKAGTILVAAGSTAHLQVGLTWRPQHPQGSTRGDESL